MYIWLPLSNHSISWCSKLLPWTKLPRSMPFLNEIMWVRLSSLWSNLLSDLINVSLVDWLSPFQTGVNFFTLLLVWSFRVIGKSVFCQELTSYPPPTLCAASWSFIGLTETCAASFIQVPDVISMNGTVGPPMPNIDARLESVPELNYDAFGETPQGEICIRGNTLFSGYYKREDLTNEVLVDGWFHTGNYSPMFLPLSIDFF